MLCNSVSSCFQYNINYLRFAFRGGLQQQQQQGYPAPMFGGGGRLSYPPAGFGIHGGPVNNGPEMKQHNHMPGQNFGPDYPPPIGTPFGAGGDMHRLMGYPAPGMAGMGNRMSGPPPSQPQGLLGWFSTRVV